MAPSGTGSGHTVPAPPLSVAALTQAAPSERARRNHTLATRSSYALAAAY